MQTLYAGCCFTADLCGVLRISRRSGNGCCDWQNPGLVCLEGVTYSYADPQPVIHAPFFLVEAFGHFD